MEVKKLSQINEGDKNDISEKEFYKFEKDNMVYYGVERNDGEIDIFDGYGNLKPYTYFFSDGFNYDILKNIEYKSLPKEVIDAIKVRETDTFKDIIGSTSMEFYKYLILGKYYYIIILSDKMVLGFDTNGNSIKKEFNPSEDTILEPIKHKLPSRINAMLNGIQIGDVDKNEYVLHTKGDIGEIRNRIKELKDMNQKELNDLLNQAIDDGNFSRAHDISQFMKESNESKNFRWYNTIHRFNDYINEGIRDQMTPKSSEDVKVALNNYLEKLKTQLEDESETIDIDVTIHDLIWFLKNVYDCKTERDLLNVLLDTKVTDVTHIIDSLIEELHYDAYGEVWKLIDIIENKMKDDN